MLTSRLRKIQTILFIVFLSHQAWAQSNAQFNWMVGTWKITTGQGYVVEQWKVLDDSTYSGKSFFVKNNQDTIPQESIQLALRKGQWYYIPTVAGQNNNQAVHFKLLFVGKTEFISANPEHDFPQRIAYRRVKQQLHASIEGYKKGKYSKQNFDFSTE